MYIVSPITVFDNDHELWETYVGTNEKDMPLWYSCWGKTEWESKTKATLLVHFLNKETMLF